MSKGLTLLFLLCALAFGADEGGINWNFKDEVELKKDQNAGYEIAIDDKMYTLTFRWTLFVNKGLVMLYKLEKFPYQNILYKDYKLNSFKIELKNRAENAYYKPYVLIVFKDFDEKKKIATFAVLIQDEKRPIQAERFLPKAK